MLKDGKGGKDVVSLCRNCWFGTRELHLFKKIITNWKLKCIENVIPFITCI